MSCSIESNTKYLAHVAATLANGGVNPFTNQRVFTDISVKNCLALMDSCGMNDESGVYSFNVGLPSKSGISGGVLVVVPGVMGLCIHSPRISDHANSVRAIKFCESLVSYYNLHSFDSFFAKEKEDPTCLGVKMDLISFTLNIAGYRNDVLTVKSLENFIDELIYDFDDRTILHLAAAEGHYDLVKYILKRNPEYAKKKRSLESNAIR